MTQNIIVKKVFFCVLQIKNNPYRFGKTSKCVTNGYFWSKLSYSLLQKYIIYFSIYAGSALKHRSYSIFQTIRDFTGQILVKMWGKK